MRAEALGLGPTAGCATVLAMGSPARRPGGGLSRKQRVDRSYKLIVATAGFGVGGLVLLIVGFGLWGFLALVVAAVAGFFLKQTLSP